MKMSKEKLERNKGISCQDNPSAIGKTSTEGITLVALVVTIVVLLILAGITISYVMGENSVFKKASDAKEQTAIAKAREKLELVLNGALMQKYSEGLTDEQLTDKINEIGEELPKEKPEHPELQNVIVDGHIFEIDRSVPRIVDYIGPADGVIITALVSGNGWVNNMAPNVSVTGTIITYSGGTITNVTATKGGEPITNFPTNGGAYTIENITEDTEIVINATDSNGKSNIKRIPVTIKVDNIKPVINSAMATAQGMKIKIIATAVDNESGLKQINYTISPETVKNAEGLLAPVGTLKSGQDLILTATEEKEYTVTFIAEDNAGNISDSVTEKATTADMMTVEEAKQINSSNIKDNIGKKVDYKSPEGGTWRIYCYDEEGYFGSPNTVYIKRDYAYELTANLQNYTTYEPTDGGLRMKKMNPLWSALDDADFDSPSAHCNFWLTDPKVWESYKTDESSYAIRLFFDRNVGSIL